MAVPLIPKGFFERLGAADRRGEAERSGGWRGPAQQQAGDLQRRVALHEESPWDEAKQSAPVAEDRGGRGGRRLADGAAHPVGQGMRTWLVGRVGGAASSSANTAIRVSSSLLKAWIPLSRTRRSVKEGCTG